MAKNDAKNGGQAKPKPYDRAAAVARYSARAMGGVTAWAGEALWRRMVLLALLGAILFLPGLGGHGPTDRDEARFAQATKQMMETGDYIEPRFQDGPRWQKPIGIYWLQAASAQAFGGVEAAIWAYRLPSALAAILAVALTSWALTPLVGPRAAFLGAAMLAGATVLSFEARTAKTDAVLLLCVVVAQGALARLWFGLRDVSQSGWTKFYLWSAIGVGALVKGPIVLLPTLGTIVWMSVRERSLAGLGRLGLGWGLVWAAMIAAPWFVAIGVKTDGAFFGAAMGEDLAGKLADRREGVGLPPGVHLLMFLGTFWPFTPLAILAAPYVWRWRRAPETAFLLGWIVPSWILFELVATKLLHYTLPIYPAIAGLAAVAALDGSEEPKGPLFWVAVVAFILPALALTIGLGVAAPLVLEGAVPVWPAIAMGAALLAFLGALRWLRNGLWLGFVRSALIGSILLYATAYVAALPGLSQLWISGRLVAIAEPYRACLRAAGADGALAIIRYHEPSAVFLAGTATRLATPEEAAEWMARENGALVWAARRRDDRRARPDEEERFLDAMARLGLAPMRLTDTTGLQYNGGRSLRLTLYARAGDPRLSGCAAPGLQ